MIRHVRSRSARRRDTVVVAVTLLAATEFVTGATGAGAAAQSQKNIDKAAVLRVGLPLLDNGGIGLDPGKQNGGPANVQWLDLVFDVMIHDTPDGKGAPGLATKWTTTDPSTVELTLRDGVKFSDGTPFNAAAVKAGVGPSDRPAAEQHRRDQVHLDRSRRSTTTTVRIHFSKPIAQEVHRHDAEERELPRRAVARRRSRRARVDTKPVGAGPYLLDSYTAGPELILTKNPRSTTRRHSCSPASSSPTCAGTAGGERAAGRERST